MTLRPALAASVLAVLLAGPLAAQEDAAAASEAQTASSAEAEAGTDGDAEAAAESADPAAASLPPPSEPFGLSGLLGLGIGMPLSEAVAVLRERGFEPDAAEALKAMSEAAAAPPGGLPDEGLLIRRTLVATPGGTRSVAIETTAFLRLYQDGVSVQVQLLAEPEVAGDPEAGGRLLAVQVYQDYGGVAGSVGWLQIEARLREAAGATPSCEALGNSRLTMVWIVDGDLAVPPQDDFAACWDRVVGAEVDAGPEAALARALGAEAAPSAPDLGALAILISPDPDAGWVWMRRFDAGLRAEALADILAGALETEPAPVTAVEF